MAGLILKTKFVSASAKSFSGFIDYIDRPEAIKKDELKDFNVFGTYQDYMSNPEKSSGLFTETKDYVSNEEKEEFKKAYNAAGKKGAVMHQTVISFETNWLEDTGILKNGVLNEMKIKEYTRATILKIKEAEHMENWICTAAIHKNTEHYHVHIAFIDPDPIWIEGKGRCRRDKNGQLYQRGKWQGATIKKAKAAFVNRAIDFSEQNKQINEIMRERILGRTKVDVLKNRYIERQLKQLLNVLPDDMRLWNYGNNAMKKYRGQIDALGNLILNEYFNKEINELKAVLSDMSEAYKRAYGETDTSFYRFKMDDLKYRMGNSILNECRDIEKLRRERLKSKIYKNQMVKGKYYGANINSSIYRIRNAFRKDIENIKNQEIYKRLQEDIDQGYI